MYRCSCCSIDEPATPSPSRLPDPRSDVFFSTFHRKTPPPCNRFQQDRRPSSCRSAKSKAGTSATMMAAFQWGGEKAARSLHSPHHGPLPPAAAAVATPSPDHPMPSSHMTPRGASSGSGGAMTMSARAGDLAEGRGGERGTTIYDICGTSPASPLGHRSRCAKVDFVPAGGRSGLDKPEGSSGRRGSVGRSLALAGGGVSRSLADDGGDDLAVDTPPSTVGGGRGGGARGATSPGIFGGEGEGGGSSPVRLSRRRQSNTGQLRDLVEAWPEEAAAAAAASPASDDGSGDRNASPGRYGSSPPGLNLDTGGLERR